MIDYLPILCIAGGAAALVFALLYQRQPSDLEGDGEFSFTYRGQRICVGRADEIVVERCPIISETGEHLAERVTVYLLSGAASDEQRGSDGEGDV